MATVATSPPSFEVIRAEAERSPRSALAMLGARLQALEVRERTDPDGLDAVDFDQVREILHLAWGIEDRERERHEGASG